jgi:hypothetical protein
MIERKNEMARRELTTKAHRAPPPRQFTDFDRERIVRAEQKRERKASRLRAGS